MKDHQGCPVQAAINVLTGKWKVQILWRLSFGQMRFCGTAQEIAQDFGKGLDRSASPTGKGWGNPTPRFQLGSTGGDVLSQ